MTLFKRVLCLRALHLKVKSFFFAEACFFHPETWFSPEIGPNNLLLCENPIVPMFPSLGSNFAKVISSLICNLFCRSLNAHIARNHLILKVIWSFTNWYIRIFPSNRTKDINALHARVILDELRVYSRIYLYILKTR